MRHHCYILLNLLFVAFIKMGRIKLLHEVVGSL